MNFKTLIPVLVSVAVAGCADHATIDIKMQKNPNMPVEPVVKPLTMGIAVVYRGVKR